MCVQIERHRNNLQRGRPSGRWPSFVNKLLSLFARYRRRHSLCLRLRHASWHVRHWSGLVAPTKLKLIIETLYVTNTNLWLRWVYVVAKLFRALRWSSRYLFCEIYFVSILQKQFQHGCVINKPIHLGFLLRYITGVTKPIELHLALLNNSVLIFFRSFLVS